MTSIPENIAVAFRYAQGLWPHDVAPGSEATAITWAPALDDYSVDELCRCLEQMARQHNKMPPLAAVLVELKDARRHAELAARPLLDPPAPSPEPQGVAFLRAAQKSRDVYTEQLKRDALKAARGHDGRVDADEVERIDAWARQVGETEAGWLREHGVEVEVTMPLGKGPLAGMVAEMARTAGIEPVEPAPLSTAELATDYARRWLAAKDDAVERERLREEGASFTPELRAAVKAVLASVVVEASA